MSDRSTMSRLRAAALLICGLLAFAAVVEGVAIWLRAGTAPEVESVESVDAANLRWLNRFAVRPTDGTMTNSRANREKPGFK
jgi:hypothetical protein